MQSLSWYYRRLRSMSPGEIAWRIQSVVRDQTDRVRLPLRLYPSPKIGLSVESPGFSVSELQPSDWSDLVNAVPESAEWLEDLRRKADRILENRLSYFDLVDKWHGDPFDWNYDHASGKRPQMSFAPAIDYRDFEKNGDCKLVWEPNRCHHLVVLGRAYRATGDKKYAQHIVTLIESWLDQNPFGMGMNWRSPMELSIRLINWVWAIDLIRDTGLFTGEFRCRVLHSVYLHLWDITRKFSKGSSANNHVIGEAAGVFIACVYFTELGETGQWISEAVSILEHEVQEQTFSDGCNKELALGYHLFVLQFFIFSGIVGERSGRKFSDDYWKIIGKQLFFLGSLVDGGGYLPMFGDCDDGYVLDLGNAPDDPYGLLCLGAVIFQHPELKRWSAYFRQPAWWLFGREGLDKFQVLSTSTENVPSSVAFPEAGLYLLQHGQQKSPEQISILFDCGPLGFKSIAAHGHADALSFTLKAFGEDILIDPGTYDYFTFPDWRNYFRSTRAHNTIMIDGEEQSVMQGAFLWGNKAECELLSWETGPDGGKITAHHNGYQRLKDPVTHQRTLVLSGSTGTVEVVDELFAHNSHSLTIFFHLAERCQVQDLGNNRFLIQAMSGKLLMVLDSCLEVAIYSGSENPPFGWVSRGYHKKTVSYTLVGTCSFRGNAQIKSRVMIA